MSSKKWIIYFVTIALRGNETLRHFGRAQDIAAVAEVANTDIAWEFFEGLEGWGESTSNEMQAEVYHMGDEMWIEIEGPNPFIDSPIMDVSTNVGLEQHLALRYRFVGQSKFGKLSLSVDERGVQNATSRSTNVDVYFPIAGDGKWHIGYVPIDVNKDENSIENDSICSISQIRIWTGCRRDSEKVWKQSVSPQSGDAFQIDWIRLVRAPIINRITGCNGEKYAVDQSFEKIHYEIDEPIKSKINGVLEHHRTIWRRGSTRYPYASTFNCLRKGEENITIEGLNFGSRAPAHVFIDHSPCTFVRHDINFPERRLTCISPPSRPEYDGGNYFRPSIIEVKNGKLPGLVGTSTQLAYASNPPAPVNIALSNFAARSIDLSWMPGGRTWQHMTYTGYVIAWRLKSSTSWTHSMATGNVSTTSVRGLLPNSTYIFGVAGLNEDQNNPLWWKTLDTYGRREILENSLEGPKAEIEGSTLMHDVNFQFFNASMTQNHGPQINQVSIGPTGMHGGEGHYGLILVGSANIANCNSSSFCCDDYDNDAGRCADDSTLTCLRSGPSVYPFSGNRPAGFEMIVANLSLYLDEDKDMFDVQCGPALRLTPAETRANGAAWYPRQLDVGEGFDTTFTFEISNPSSRCNNMDGIFAHCRSTGGDGFAFVIQGDHPNALGHSGLGLGYDGINNSIAIEFDTYNNHETIDPYENHISVQTRGWRHLNSANHTFSLGHTNAVQSLTNGKLKIRIKYEPAIDANQIFHPSFVLSPHVLTFSENKDENGRPDWSIGLGMLSVYCQNLKVPVLSVPIHVPTTLHLNAGRAWVGFTAATGVETHQAHDIHSWQFSSLRKDSSATESNGAIQSRGRHFA